MALHGFSGKRQSLLLQLCGQCCHQAASCNIGENLRCVVPQNSTRLTNMLGRLVSGIFQTLPRIIAPNQCPTVGSAAQTGSMIFARTKVRVHWQRPSEHKRITKFGWKTRMSTPNGRKMLMRAILKGKHVLSH